MMFKENIKHILLVGFILVILYNLYSYLVLSPHVFSSFSLIDDGQSIQNSDYFNKCFFNASCNELKDVLIEKTFGRFRPIYWAIQHFLYTFLDLNPVLHHQFRIYVVGSILLLILLVAVFQSGGGSLTALISSFVFFSTYSYSENIIRLGPVEPYQVLFVGLTSLLFLSKNKYRFKLFILFSVAIISLLVKETSIVLVVPILTIHYISNKSKFENRYILLGAFMIVIFLAGRILSRPEVQQLAYVENFQLDVFMIVNNIKNYFNIIQNSVGLLIKVTGILLIFAFFNDSLRKKIFDRYLYFWILLGLASIAVLLPWKHVLERYVLLTLFCLSIVIGVILSKTIKHFENRYIKNIRGKFIISVVFLIALSSILFYGFPVNLSKSMNYRNWYKEFLKFEHDQVYAISKFEDRLVYINAVDTLDNWEVLYEIPIHLKYIYNSDTEIRLLDEKKDLPIGGYVFTRIPFIHAYPYEEIKDMGIIVDHKNYEISQIDPLEFRKKFYQKPIHSIIDPPLKEDKFIYYWEIRKL